MPSSTTISLSITTAILTACMLRSYAYALWEIHSPTKKQQRVRRKLPSNLETWRIPVNRSHDEEEQIWTDLNEAFTEAGYQLWRNVSGCSLYAPGDDFPIPSGFGYCIPSRGYALGPGCPGRLKWFECMNPLQRAARTREGQDVIIRLIVIGNEGHEHLKVLRKIAKGKDGLFSNNHTLPMLAEFQFEDLTFGIFPKVGSSLELAYGCWAKNSVGDVVEMIMQMLEALAFIHNLNIAHRDASRDNFLVQWQPESLQNMKISPSRPRVYLIDFEVAIQFPPELPTDQCTTMGFPLGGSFTDLETYARPHAPEFTSGKAYSPFKLDVWQLGKSLQELKTTIPGIDEILVRMTDHNFEHRPSATEALDCLTKIVQSMVPESLLIEPVFLKQK
ncbi:kinase-like domain-containing protein [Crassisporium funariophilum]|nr:kinase-like domain-containing protein [Crassisporium funariophilum]